MVGRRLLLVVTLAVVLALIGVEPGGLRSEPEEETRTVAAPTAQNGATGVNTDSGAHGATIVAAVRSMRDALERLSPMAPLIALVVALVQVALRPSWRLQLVYAARAGSPWRAGTAALRGPPAIA